ncbi:HEAT repeat domain-containing protein [Pseudobacteriovorax antillogorgiicola]|uniref:HEAT repeat-containing protein n=1 Tax=Pseudobacteriovorax antillogorgiicola TaxID=1513793 RepID=A0A1Y6BJI5_9BACT|nr:HEAT repeat domain-containing protein [Pseudobacteriovorax antillogorgiicola]TCS55325.1 hypothetical protein EDD56_10546 [Pseudobacteriovorax antillogorgiicola]SMF14155.1 hypothetical protein SAMN06296036_105278 [Pseudobacteriovorax antillogorgiicola]
MLQEFVFKAEFLRTHKYQDLIEKISHRVRFKLTQEKAPKFPQGLIKTIQLDLSYIFFRHQAWIHAPVLAELSIDYLHSEFHLSRQVATDVVESALDLLHSYIPTEPGWSARDYDYEFLFQMFISSASSDNQSQLVTEIGFGTNVIELLFAAAKLNDSRLEDTVVFAPELTETLHRIMDEISKEIAETPWVIDLYKLKSLIEAVELHGKHLLTRAYLELCFEVMIAIGWSGTTFDELTKDHNQAQIKKVLDQLISAEVVYVQGARKRITYHLGILGLDLIAERAACQMQDFQWSDLFNLPGPVQVKLLDRSNIDIAHGAPILARQLDHLDPKAVYSLFSRLSHENPGSIADVLSVLPHRRLSSWVKSELCRALSMFGSSKAIEDYLESLIKGDPSIKVRERARSSLKDWRRTHRTHDNQREKPCRLTSRN